MNDKDLHGGHNEKDRFGGLNDVGAGTDGVGDHIGRGGRGLPPVEDATVKVAEQQELNFASILKGTAANKTNLFEKKAALINA